MKEQAGVSRVFAQKLGNGPRPSITIGIDSPLPDRANVARTLLEVHFKQQIKLQNAEKRLLQTRTTLYEVQGEMAAGTRIEFKVSVELIGLIIGKKGVRVKEIQEDTGVTSIHIDGTTGT